MISRAFALALLALLAAVPAAHAQPHPSRALANALYRDLNPDHDDIAMFGRDSLARWTIVTREDFNGDGVPEWVVNAARFCGTNCQWWVYRRLPGGRFAQVHDGGGVSMVRLRRRSHGWQDIREYWHSSCCDGTITLWRFDGTRYRWAETRYEARDTASATGMRTVYRVAIAPARSGRRRLVLDPVNAGRGVRVAARYDLCGNAGCAAPQLHVTSASLSAGRACITVRTRYRYQSSPMPVETVRLCGTTTPGGVSAGRATRTLVLRPGPGDWGKLWFATDVEIHGAGLSGRIDTHAGYALGVFAARLAAYRRLQCPGVFRRACTSPP